MIQRVPPAEPVKTQIAARLIVMLGSAPELGFVHGVQKQGNEIVTQTGFGRVYFLFIYFFIYFLTGLSDVTRGVMRG